MNIHGFSELTDLLYTTWDYYCDISHYRGSDDESSSCAKDYYNRTKKKLATKLDGKIWHCKVGNQEFIGKSFVEETFLEMFKIFSKDLFISKQIDLTIEGE